MSYRGGEGRRDDRPRWGQGKRDPPDRRGPQDRRGQRPYQPSYVGNKRGREEQAPADPKRELIKQLLNLGEPQDPKDTPEGTIMPAVRALKQEIAQQMPGLDELVIEVVCGASTKTTHVALVIGLTRMWEHDWVDSLVRRAVEECSKALEAGGEGRDRARLLARWLSCLVGPGVVTGTSAARLLLDLVGAANKAAEAGAATDPSGGTWQPWTDHLAYCALGALPWAGADLATSAPGDLGVLMDAIEKYMGARVVEHDGALAPFQPAALPEGDSAAAADSGGATFLGHLWCAVRDCQDECGWAVAGVPRLLALFEEQLARGAGGGGGAEGVPEPLELPPLDVPPAAPTSAAFGVHAAAARAMSLRAAYPPRGGLVLLPRDKVEEGRPAIERIVAEEYILDSVSAYDLHRVDLAKLLVTRLPLPYDHLGVLIETLLGQMVRLPTSALRPVAYNTLLMDVCKLARESPKYMAAWIRAVYDRMVALDPELRGRVADYLAHHLSNFQWLWGWERWQDVLAQSPGHPQRVFCCDVLQRMVGLSYWEHLKDGWAQAVDPETRETRRIKKFLPVEWEPLLGPKPEIPPLAGTVHQQRPQQQQEAKQQEQEQEQDRATGKQQADVEMQDGEGKQPENGSGEQPQEQDRPEGHQQQREEEQEPVTPETEWAARLLDFLRARKAPAGAPHTAADVLQWIKESGLRAQLGGAEPALRAASHAIFAAGAKTPTHLNVMVERYGAVLQQLVQEVGQEDQAGGEAVVLDALVVAYGQHPARLLLTADRLQSSGVIAAAPTVAWALRWDWLQLRPPSDPIRAGAALALLRGALALALAAEGAVHEAATRQGAAVRDAEQQLAAAREELQRAHDREAAAESAGPAGGPARPSARVDFALRGQAAAAQRLKDARAELEQLEAKVSAAGPALGDALMALYSGLAARLGGDGMAEGGGDDEDAAAARREALAQARALVRSVALPSQERAEDIVEMHAPGEVAEDLRTVVLGQLGLA